MQSATESAARTSRIIAPRDSTTVTPCRILSQMSGTQLRDAAGQPGPRREPVPHQRENGTGNPRVRLADRASPP